MVERGTRFERSVLTFGPLGRVVATVVVLLPLAWFALYANMWGMVGVPLYLIWVVPRALRDVWRPAALPATELTRLRDEMQVAADVAARYADRPVADPENPGQPRW